MTCIIVKYIARGNRMKNIDLNKYQKKRKKTALLFACLILLLSGCSFAQKTVQKEPGRQDGPTAVGPILTVDAPPEFTLLDNKDVLAADGLYYATWGAGDSSPYENSDGDTIELYDAQLYLLASESKDEKNAEKSRQAWLSAAEGNYKIHTTDTITCNGQSYILIAYDCISENTPYDHGVSALGVSGANAVCAELTCTKNYEEELTALLTDFLNSCQYIQQ